MTETEYLLRGTDWVLKYNTQATPQAQAVSRLPVTAEARVRYH
jgi:hypothetical protein